MNERARIVIIAGIAIFVGLVIWAVLAYIFRSPPEGSITDKDTGTTMSITLDEGVSDGAAGEEFASGTPIFGLLELNKALSNNKGLYTDYIRPAIQDFTKKRLDNKFSTVTIRPQDTKINGQLITSSLRLGQGNDILPFSITISDNNKSLILNVEDPENKYGGGFIHVANLGKGSTLYTIDYEQSIAKSSDPIKISINASMSYREAALQSIQELGFSPAEFLITFKQYENPFK